MCDLEVMGVPSILSIIRKAGALARVRPTLDFSWAEQAERRKWKSPRSCFANWTPESAKKRSVSRWAYKNKSRTNSLCNLPDVLVYMYKIHVRISIHVRNNIYKHNLYVVHIIRYNIYKHNLYVVHIIYNIHMKIYIDLYSRYIYT